MRDFPTGTVTLLFTNIESSTQLLQLAAEGYAGLLDTSRSLLRARFLASHPWPTVAAHPLWRPLREHWHIEHWLQEQPSSFLA